MRFAISVLPLILLPLAAACARQPAGSGDPAPGASASAAAPAIAFDAMTHDFGKLSEGEVARHVFKVKNTGSGPLEISNVRSSCGCTAAVLNTPNIPPGGSGEIEVKFNTQNRRGKTEKTITVTTNDPANKSVVLKISANVETLLALAPVYSFMDAAIGEKTVKESWLEGKLARDAKLSITTVEPQGQGEPAGALPVRAELIDKQENGASRRGLRLELIPKQVGPGAVRVILATGLEQPAQLEHMVRWNVRGNIQAPRTVFLDLSRPTLKERRIQVSSREAGFVLRAARVTEGPFTAEVGTPDAGSGFEVVVKSTLTAPPPELVRGTLVLESNDKLEPKKELTVTVAAQPRGVRPSPSGAPR